MIQRIISNQIREQLFKGKILLLFGPRQVGKTTLLRAIYNEFESEAIWLNADENDIRLELTTAKTSTALINLIGKQHRLVIIDEAQQIPDIGQKLKLLYDSFPEVQVIATGSSVFELSNTMNEPLTGRKRTFYLLPFSFQELVNERSLREEKRSIAHRIKYGYYPDVIKQSGEEREVLFELTESYLYKDILQLEGIRKPVFLEKILLSLALQVGSEVSYHELSKSIGNINAATVESYIDLLEKSFVVFKLPALSRNFRNEIKKGKKYYFYDSGIRNAILNNFLPIDQRMDKGGLWENFVISERLKYNLYQRSFPNTYFWRTKDQAEIDYIEEIDGILHAFEVKWKKSKVRLPKSFQTSYPNHIFSIINLDNIEQHLIYKD